MKRLLTAVAMAGAVALGVSGAVQAAFPEKPVKMIVAYKAGGASDVASRIVAKYMEKELGVPVVIVNVAGGGGSVGYRQLMKAKPDGYTIGVYNDAMGVMEATKAISFSHKDYDPVALFGQMYLTVFTKPGNYAGLADMMADAKKRPGKVGLAMGYGTPAQFYAKVVEDAMHEDLNLVNVGGGAQKKAAVMGGHVEAGIEPMPGMIGPHSSGQLKIIAVLAPERLNGFDVPTAREQGVDALASLSYGVIGPKGMPADRVKVLSEAMGRVQQNPEYAAEMKKLYLDPTYLDTPEWSQRLDAIRDKMLGLGKALGF